MKTQSMTTNGAVITVAVLLVVFLTYRLAVPVPPAPVPVTTIKPTVFEAPSPKPVSAPAPVAVHVPTVSVPPPLSVSTTLPTPMESPVENQVKVQIQVPDPLILQHQTDLLSMKSMQDQIGTLKLQLADANDKAAMWQSILVQQDTLVDVFSTAIPDLPVYRQNVYVVISLPQAAFNFNSTKISEASQRRLALIAKIFNRYDGIFYLGIEGHTDNVPVKAGGKYADNVALGMARANRAYQVLLQAGVAPEKMAVISWGAALPVVPHAKQQADPANRRVELVFAPQRAIEHPEPVASLLTPDVRARLRAYSEAFLNNRNILHLGVTHLQAPQTSSVPPASSSQTAYTQGH